MEDEPQAEGSHYRKVKIAAVVGTVAGLAVGEAIQLITGSEVVNRWLFDVACASGGLAIAPTTFSVYNEYHRPRE